MESVYIKHMKLPFPDNKIEQVIIKNDMVIGYNFITRIKINCIKNTRKFLDGIDDS